MKVPGQIPKATCEARKNTGMRGRKLKETGEVPKETGDAPKNTCVAMKDSEGNR